MKAFIVFLLFINHFINIFTLGAFALTIFQRLDYSCTCPIHLELNMYAIGKPKHSEWTVHFLVGNKGFEFESQVDNDKDCHPSSFVMLNIAQIHGYNLIGGFTWACCIVL